jgi:hypothetical protein
MNGHHKTSKLIFGGLTFWILILILESCHMLTLPKNGQIQETIGITKTSSISSTRLVSTQTEMPLTPILPTALTKVPTKTPTPQPKTESWKPVPLIIQTAVPEQNKLSGWLVMLSRPSNLVRASYILNPATGEKKMFVDADKQNAPRFITSPDGNWLAYTDSQWIKMESVDGKQTKKIWWDDKISILIEWLDNEHINVLASPDSKGSMPTIILNPFSGNKQIFKLDSFEKIPKIMGNRGVYFESGNLKLDPTLNLVVYPQMEDGKYWIALWDIQKGKLIIRLEDLNSYEHDPLWSLDGQDFVVPILTNYESGGKFIYNWFKENRNGEIHQLTHFEDNFEYSSIMSASRSPNGRYVAFWLATGKERNFNGYWVVLDLKTNQLNNFYIESNDTSYASRIIWSLDSNYFAVTNCVDLEYGAVILADVKGAWAAKIAEDQTVQGWLVDP